MVGGKGGVSKRHRVAHKEVSRGCRGARWQSLLSRRSLIRWLRTTNQALSRPSSTSINPSVAYQWDGQIQPGETLLTEENLAAIGSFSLSRKIKKQHPQQEAASQRPFSIGVNFSPAAEAGIAGAVAPAFVACLARGGGEDAARFLCLFVRDIPALAEGFQVPPSSRSWRRTG